MPAISKIIETNSTERKEEQEVMTEDFLNSLKRKELLNLCKERGIKASGKNSELIERLLNEFSGSCKVTEPMTPKKAAFNRADVINPLMNTPTTTATIKSILQSARKTALNSSPIRVPFALSPMAHKQHSFPTADTLDEIRKCPLIVAKDPSKPIKEAFLSNNSNSISNETELDQFLSPLPNNKRSHENEEEEEVQHVNACEEVQDYDVGLNEEEDIIQQHKKERLEEITNAIETTDKNNDSHQDYNDVHDEEMNIMNARDYNNNITQEDSINNESFTSTESDNRNLNEFSSSSASFTLNYSQLLENPKDPELKSPELLSCIDRSISRSEHQDRSTTTARNNPLLPSGIIKLLEKKRQERLEEQQQQQKQQLKNSTSSIHTNSATNRKKFDLQESLKKPLPYRPHLGSLKTKQNPNPPKQPQL